MLYILTAGQLISGLTKAWIGNIGEVSFNNHTHTITDITSGILGITNGGTGVNTLDDLKNVLGLQTNIKYESGTRKGTNKTSPTLTFSINPLLVIMMTPYTTSTDQIRANIFIRFSHLGLYLDETPTVYRRVLTWTDNSVSWKANSATMALDSNSITYGYFSIGY